MNLPEPQRSIPALYMRGGTSKGVFINADDLPVKSAERDALLLRLMGSPDPYRQQLDGMGGASSSTSKVILVRASSHAECDVEYVFGQVSIDRQLVDWSGNCGNLTSAVGPYAIHRGLVPAGPDGVKRVRLWQAGIQKRIIAHVPVHNGQVVEMGDFELDGVAFPAAEIKLDFLDPGASDAAAADGGAAPTDAAHAGAEDGAPRGGIFPTGNPQDQLWVPDLGTFKVTLINAGNPTVFVEAADLQLDGTELPADLNADVDLLARLESIRARAAVAMGLAPTPKFASEFRQHTPKLAFVSRPQSYVSTSGKLVQEQDIDLTVRIISMGKLHHAMTGTGAVAIAAAAAIPETLISARLGGPRASLRFGHSAGVLKVGAEAVPEGAGWRIVCASMSRSARRLMDGVVFLP